MKPASASRKGSAFEREIAAMIGGGAKRNLLSGAAGGNDLLIPSDSIWASWGIEAKRRARLPAMVTQALSQAQAAIPIGSPLRPAAVVREDRGRALFIAELADVDRWCRALAEVGQGQRVKSILRGMERDIEAIRGLV